MSLNVPLLKSSFDLVVERAPDLTGRFYEKLFARHPEVQRMFYRRSRATQEEMLTTALGAVLDHLDDAPWLVEQLAAMGAKHEEYGVRPEMYGWVGDALLATLAEVAGEAWTGELSRAWTAAYGAISSMMLAGAQAVAAAALSQQRAQPGPRTCPFSHAGR